MIKELKETVKKHKPKTMPSFFLCLGVACLEEECRQGKQGKLKNDK